MTELRLGTRGSQLALWQARTVAARIEDAGGPPCRLVVIKTSGDRLQDAPLSEIGGKRLFVKEIEDALVRDEIDLAVHSSKDMPAAPPDGLVVAGVLFVVPGAVAIMALMFWPGLPIAMTDLNKLVLWPATLVQFWAGRRFYVAAWRSARHGGVNMNTLVALGTSAAYGLSLYLWLFPAHEGHTAHLYFESSSVVIAFVLIAASLTNAVCLFVYF